MPTPVTVMPPVGLRRRRPPPADRRPQARRRRADGNENAIRMSFMTCSFSGFELNTPPRRLRVTIAAVRYQFVDCRWELGNPGAGRELYLAGHIPGASFLDVDDDLRSLRGRRAAPAARRGATLPPPLRGPGSATASSSSPTECSAAPSGSGGCSATSATTRSRSCAAGSKAGAGRCERAGGDRGRALRPAATRRATRSTAEELAARLGDPGAAPARCARPGTLPRRAEPDRQGARPDSGRAQRAVHRGGPLPEDVLAAEEIVAYCGSGVTACVTLFALAEAGRPRREALSGLVERVGRVRSAPRARVDTDASRAGSSVPRGG